MNILLCISYDGSAFHGYQIQDHSIVTMRTVQGELESCLKKLFGDQISTYVAGRTDAKVHASRQYVNFHLTSLTIPVHSIAHILNSKLPSDMRVLYSKQVSHDFHARYSAQWRCYYYQFYEGKTIPPIYRLYSTGVSSRIDWSMLMSDASSLLGTHDFSSFTVGAHQQKSPIREITNMVLHEYMPFQKRLFIVGVGFLWKMVRGIIGTLLDRAIIRARGEQVTETMSQILQHKDRRAAGSTAFPHGLCLYEVKYHEKYDISHQEIPRLYVRDE